MGDRDALDAHAADHGRAAPGAAPSGPTLGLLRATTMPAPRYDFAHNGINHLSACHMARQAPPANWHAKRVCRPETSLPAHVQRWRWHAALALRVPCRVAEGRVESVADHAARMIGNFAP